MYFYFHFASAQELQIPLERKQNENKKIHDKMKEEIEKMDQAVADSSSFIKRMKSKDSQHIAYEKTTRASNSS